MVIRRFVQASRMGWAGLSTRSYNRLDLVTQGWIVVASGSVARLGLGFVASIIIARALGPTAFGVYAVLAAVASFTGAAVDLGLTNAAVRRVTAAWPDDLDRALEIWRAFFWLRVLVVGCVTVIGLTLAGPISSMILDVSGRDTYLRLALLGVAATVLSGTVTGMLQATSRFGRLSAVLLTNSGLTVVLALGLAQQGVLTITTALLILGIGTSLVSFGLAFRLLPGRWTLRPPSRSSFAANSRDLTTYGVWLWIGSIFGILALYLDVMIVNHWMTAATVGVYALAVNLAIKVEVVNQSLYTVLLPAASALRSGRDVRNYIRRGLIRSGLIGVALLPLFPLARPLIGFFYGEAYVPAATVFQGLLAIAILNVLLTPLLMLAFTYDRPVLVAMTESVRALTLLITALALVPALGTTGAIIAKLLAAIAGGGIILAFIYRVVLPTGNLPVDSK